MSALTPVKGVSEAELLRKDVYMNRAPFTRTMPPVSARACRSFRTRRSVEKLKIGITTLIWGAVRALRKSRAA